MHHRGAVGLLTLSAMVVVLAGAGVAAAAGPPFPERIAGQSVYDTAGVLDPMTRTQAEQIAEGIAIEGVDVVVFTQVLDGETTTAETVGRARALLEQWDVGGPGGTGMVMLADITADGEVGAVAIVTGPGMAVYIDDLELAAIQAEMEPFIATDDLDTAVVVALARTITEVLGGSGGSSGGAAGDRPSPGPPFPDPVDGQAVYDFAGILSAEAISKAEATIDAIEARTAAEVVVYTQPVDYGVTTSETEQRAIALIDQWGVGRAGFDDGLAIFFDIDPSGDHGQVQLYAAPGFENAFLTNSERQAIFDDDMLPYLRVGDFDGALGAALERVDAAATPENAARLQAGRQVNAVLGLVGAPVVFLGLAGWAFYAWRRFGKDPVYLDSPSILMPAPPADLTAASGAFVMDGGTSRRALTTALLDLASRGLISFREDRGLLGLSTKVGVDTDPPKGDDIEEARRRLNARRPTGPAEGVALQRLRAIDGTDGFISPDDLPKFGMAVPAFDKALEHHVVKEGWMVERPSAVVGRWGVRSGAAIGAGVIAIIVGINVPISGLILIGAAAIAGGIVIGIFARWMPAVTMPGAMIRAMLHAYRRTLHKTMEQARSMQQVVDEAGLDWLETPDQAVVWGTALGLQGDIEDVLKRSLQDVEAGRSAVTSTYFPGWYRTSDGSSFATAAASGRGGSIFSGSAVPNLGGMMSALGTIGNSPSSSSGSGGGGFSGGSSGGGGGGAGGGF